MCLIIRDYCTSIFADSVEVDVDPIVSARTVSGEQNVKLVEEVTLVEFTLVIK